MKRFLKYSFYICVLTVLNFSLFAQDSARIRISLLTCTPGAELYSTFGHSALRVVDSNSVSDMVFNYGTFNFDDDGFYVKFVRGKLLYYVSVEPFESFRFDYQVSNRGITEQVLDLSGAERRNLYAALRENQKEENKFYKYDFFLDNCTTRLRDLIVSNKNPHPVLPAVMPDRFRFRQAIHQYLDLNKKYWSKLGIDLLLGAPCDAVMSTSQQQFLPDNLMLALDGSRNVTIVASKLDLYPIAVDQHKLQWFTPMTFFSALLIIYFLLGQAKQPVIKNILYGLDGLLFFFTGIMGVLFLVMWFGTDHTMTKENYNLLWAWPTHLFFSFVVNSKKEFARKYFQVCFYSMVVVLLIWFILPQQMNNALLPLVILLVYRSWAAGKRHASFVNINTIS